MYFLWTRQGQMLVETKRIGAATLCEFLRITAAAGPTFAVGDHVVYTTDEEGVHGYLLGLLENYPKPEDVPKTVKIEALESIELTCGASTLVMTKAGRINLRGGDITSRASRINKVKGAGRQNQLTDPQLC
jgi:hypothetical protein